MSEKKEVKKTKTRNNLEDFLKKCEDRRLYIMIQGTVHQDGLREKIKRAVMKFSTDSMVCGPVHKQ